MQLITDVFTHPYQTQACHAPVNLRRLCLAAQLLIVLALLLAGALASAVPIDADAVLPASTLSFGLLASWTLLSWCKVQGTLFDPYALFLVSSWLFNGAQVLLEIFGLNRRGILGGKFSSETLLATVYLVALAISAMHLGALWASSPQQVIGQTLNGRMRQFAHNAWHTRGVGWILFAIAIGPAISNLSEAVRMVMSGGYMSLYQRTLETSYSSAPRLLANFLVPSALSILAGSKSRRMGILMSAFIIVVYAIGMFFLGGRAAAATALVAYIWLYSRTVRPIPAGILIAPALAIVFIVFPLVGAMRNSSGDNRISSESVVNAWSAMDNPVVVSFSEVGSSMSAVSHTLDLVPTVRPFDAGASYLYALLMVMPNLAWEVHPTSAHGTLSLWLVKTVAPATAALGGGLGYSFIAETYENFDWVGVPLVMLVLGWCAGKLSSIVGTRRDPAVLALAATLLSFALIYPRSETSDLVRNVSWYGYVPFLLTRLLSRVHS